MKYPIIILFSLFFIGCGNETDDPIGKQRIAVNVNGLGETVYVVQWVSYDIRKGRYWENNSYPMSRENAIKKIKEDAIFMAQGDLKTIGYIDVVIVEKK